MSSMLLLGASGLSVTYADLGTLLETVHVLEMKQNMSGRGVPLTIKLKQDHVFLQLNVQILLCGVNGVTAQANATLEQGLVHENV